MERVVLGEELLMAIFDGKVTYSHLNTEEVGRI